VAAGHDELDEAALETLYIRLEKPLYNVVYRWLWDPAESRDLVQDAFLRLWQMRRHVRMKTVEPLIYRIALNLVARRRRSRRLWKWTGLNPLREADTGGGGPEDGMLERERADSVRHAVEQLPDTLRSVVVLCELSPLTYAEIGRLLSIPPGTVGSRRNKALELLRGALGAETWAVSEAGS